MCMEEGEKVNKRVTLKDLAQYTGFSITTVSLVLNNNAVSIPDSVKKQIVDAAKELNYIPNIAARSLVSGTSKTIGVIIPDISNSFFATLVHDMQIELNKYSYDIFLCNSDEKMENDIKYINLFSSRAVDGMILVLSAESLQNENQERIKSLLDSLFVPYILVDRYFASDAYKVMIDNYDAGAMVAAELFKNGHQRIGFITGPLSLNSSINRLQGALDYLKTKGINPQDANVYTGKYDYDTGYQGARKLLKNKISAIFAFNDLQAYGVIECCNELGIKIPGDISLIGFDNSDTSKIIRPKLSSVEQPIAELSLLACQNLMALIERKPCEKEIRLKSTIILRDSIGRVE